MADLVLLALLLGGYVLFFRWIWREDPRFRQPTTCPAAAAPATPAAQQSVLFVCTHNSARSQMAEALLREMAGDRFHVASAGTSPTSVHPLAEAVMADRRLTLRSHRAKPLAEMGTRWDYVITLCDEAFEECPDFPAKTCRLHWRIEDPSRSKETAEEQLEAFCRVRDDLALRLRRWVAEREERP